MRNVSEKINTHILCSVIFFSSENLGVYGKMWTNIVEPGRPQMTIWRMRIACWISKAKNTLRMCIARAELDGTRPETRIRLSPKRTSSFKSVGGVSSVECW